MNKLNNIKALESIIEDAVNGDAIKIQKGSECFYCIWNNTNKNYPQLMDLETARTLQYTKENYNDLFKKLTKLYGRNINVCQLVDYSVALRYVNSIIYNKEVKKQYSK